MAAGDLRIAHVNAKGLNPPRRELLEKLSQKLKLDIICVTETHLKPKRPLKFRPHDADYNVIRADRPVQVGGGIAILAPKTIPLTPLPTPPLTNRTEALIVRLHLKPQESTILCCIYHPDGRLPLDPNLLHYLDTLSTDNIVVCGDFNSRHTAWGCHTINQNGTYMHTHLTGGNTLVLLNTPEHTHYPLIAGHRPSTIDLFLVSANLLPNAEYSVEGDIGSDHLMINCRLKGSIVQPVPPPPRESFNFNKANWALYEVELNRTLQTTGVVHAPLGAPAELEQAATALNDCILHAARTTLPKSTPRPYRRPPLPRHILTLIRERRTVLQRIKAGQIGLCPRRNQLSTQIHRLISEHQANQWKRTCDSIDSRDIHKPAGAIIRNCGKFRTPDVPLRLNGQSMCTDPEKAGAFSETLHGAFQVQQDANFDRGHAVLIRHHILANPTLYQPHARPTPDIDDHHPLSQPISYDEVAEALRRAPNKSPGPDLIRNPLLRQGPIRLHAFLALLLIRCLALGYFPKIWKQAEAILIPKGAKDKSDPSNYRPISLLPVIGKLFERILTTRIASYLEVHHRLSDFQSGFRTGHSTSDQLLRLTEAIQRGWKQSRTARKTAACFLDVAKAFDSVWHDALRYKLSQPRYALPTKVIRLLSNYLDDRTCRVRVNTSTSPWFPINAGVPQGGSLSPLLYILFANDMPIPPPLSSAQSQYADDLAIWATCSNSRRAAALLQLRLDAIAQWCNKWRVKLNPAKTELIYFSRHTCDKPPLHVNGQAVAAQPTVKFLGVTFDEKLLFESHIRRIRQQCAAKLRALQGIASDTHGPDPATVIRLYKSYIMPHLFYGCVAWSPLLSLSLQRLLDSVQNRACRIALRFPWWAPRAQLRRLTGLTPITELHTRLSKNYVQRATPRVALIRRLVASSAPVPPNVNPRRVTTLQKILQ